MCFDSLTFILFSTKPISLLESTGLSSHLPSSLQDLPNLLEVQLTNNTFEGNVSFPAATGLTQLYLSRNAFSGSMDVSTNTKIQKLILDDNQFTGPLPDLASLTMLEVLSVARNHFTGPPPHLSLPPLNLTRL